MSTNPSETMHNLKRWHSGEAAGLNELLKRHISWIHARVRKRLGTRLRQRIESLDIVQDAALQFLQYAPRFLISNEKQFRALVAKIVENVLRDKHDWYTARRRAISLERPLPSESVLYLDYRVGSEKTPSISAQRHEEEALIRLGMELLDPEDREILVLHQWDHLSFAEIGKRLKLAPDVAWKKHQRAFARLADKVGYLRRGRLSRLLEDTET